MSNEYHDIAALNSSRVDGAGERTWRVGLFCQILLACVSGRPCLEEMGLRLWLLCERLCPGCLPRTNAALRRRLNAAAVSAWRELQVEPGETSVVDMARLVDVLLGGEVCPVKLGRRVTLLGYAFERGPLMRSVLPSFEGIGHLWGLRAENPRSAVCAAMKKLVGSMVERGQLRAPEAHELTELWFAKKRKTRASYAAAQMGNHNRCGEKQKWESGKQKWDAMAVEDRHEGEPLAVREALRREHAERVAGVPVKREFAAMKPAELRAHFLRLEREQERRRLGLGLG